MICITFKFDFFFSLLLASSDSADNFSLDKSKAESWFFRDWGSSKIKTKLPHGKSNL